MATEFEKDFYELMMAVMTRGAEVEVGEWQSQDVRNDPNMISRELRHVHFEMRIPDTVEELDEFMGATLSRPWAEDHFQERVSGYPWNPPPSESYWPYAKQNHAQHKITTPNGQQLFSHTYPERFWPKKAGMEPRDIELAGDTVNMKGIRYGYGDLDDVVNQLRRNTMTRQAYLPIWFPEDTGATNGQRVPCTLGYHFLLRPDVADIVYFIRSCDLLRHFTDDVYMACRLLQFVMAQLRVQGASPIPKTMRLVMSMSSLHFFKGDYDMVQYRVREWHKRTDGEEDTPYGAAI